MPGTQPSAPPFQNYRARWLQYPLASENVPPLFDYEHYRAHRGSSFSRGPASARSNADAAGCAMDLSSIVNACYDNHAVDGNVVAVQQHQYSYGCQSSVRGAMGPPAFLAGGGFDRNYQKSQRKIDSPGQPHENSRKMDDYDDDDDDDDVMLEAFGTFVQDFLDA